MKKIRLSIILAAGAALLFSASCKKEYFTSVNKNPNSPNWVQPALYLSTVEGTLAYTQGGDMSRFASMFIQQTNGVSRQSAAYMNYIFSGQDVDNLWGDLYASVMINDSRLMHESDSLICNEYSGISRVLMAYTMLLTVDNFGKAPYSKAFMGLANLQPAYDDDAALYATIQGLCDSGVIYLNNPAAGFLTPGSEDAIYGGNAGAWVLFAHAIKARTYIHQAKPGGATSAAMATNALAEIAMSFGSNADNAIYNGFGNASTANNPWFQFNNQRGDISFTSSTMWSAMAANNDPRLNMMYDSTAADGGDYIAGYYGANPNAVVELITYDELQLMAAEATITKGGTIADAQAFYQAGITASCSKLGVSPTAYLATNGTLTSSGAMASICYEEWVALFLNPEAWTMYRRTGLPVLTAPAQASSTTIPRRLLYPQTEYSYNKANVPAKSSLYTPKIFWDK